MPSTDTNTSPSTKATLLVLAAWFLATPVCLYLAFWDSIALFGDQPSDADLAQAKWWLAGGAVTGFGLPGWAFGRAWDAGDRPRQWLFGGALALSLAAFVVWRFLVSV